jgi:Z1 domain-containing protein
MNDQLANAYIAALAMMQVTGPSDLHSAANFVSNNTDGQLDDAALIAYMKNVGPNDPLQMDLRLKLAGWDHLGSEVAWTLGTASNTTGRRDRTFSLLALGDEMAELLLALFPIAAVEGPIVIAADWESWYSEAIKIRRSFYWDHYKGYLAGQRHWEPKAILSLDIATDEIIERVSDPQRAIAYQTKGLVVGHVQSGKTANFTGVIAKAVDVGYRLIIVLTGTTDLLRSQTQRRLDMELVGQENILRGVNQDDHEALEALDYYADDPDWNRFLSHGLRPQDAGRPDIHRLTTRDFDYKSLQQGIAALDFERRERHLPFFHPDNLFNSDARLIVVKKNGPVLRKLVKDLNKITARLGEIPALLIDDESDQASVNTSNPKKWKADQVERTAINKLVSQLLTMLPRGQYIGYTATPFANVFIDPSDSEDIFPGNFIISLRKPPGYMGASDFHDLTSVIPLSDRTFSNSAEKAHVRMFDSDDPADMEQKLQEAIDFYTLAGAVKLFRLNQVPIDPRRHMDFRHHTMLVHEAMRRAHHREQADQILKLWNSAGYHSPTCLDRLEKLYQTDTLPASLALGQLVSPSFSELMPYIGRTVERIGQTGNPVLIVNSDKIEGEELDFDRNEVWRILVGGNKFARGFTIEGLTVSYYGRPARNADTLMQMGRWFGFREGYQDLVRLYTSPELYEAFEAVCLDEAYFRNEIAQYSIMVDGEPQVIPAQVPPLVASHLQRLRPSAPNKMYNAVLSQRRTADKEPTGYPRLADHKSLAHNTHAFKPLLEAVSIQSARSIFHEGRIFEVFESEIAHFDVLHVLRALIWDNEDCFKADLAWLETLSKDELDRWLVWLPQLKNPRTAVIEDLGPFSLHTRAGVEYLNVKTTVDDRRAIEAETRADGSARGGMLIYPMVSNDLQHSPGDAIDPGSLVMAFRLTLPRSAAPADGRLVTFVARDKSRWNQPIIDRPT